MFFNTIHENKTLSKISRFTVSREIRKLIFDKGYVLEMISEHLDSEK